jgi:hypothetical protein
LRRDRKKEYNILEIKKRHCENMKASNYREGKL